MAIFMALTGQPRAGRRHAGPEIAKFPHIRRLPFITSSAMEPDRKKGVGDPNLVEGEGYTRASLKDFEVMEGDPKKYLVFRTKHNINAIDIGLIESITRNAVSDGFMVVTPSLAASIAGNEILGAHPRVITVMLSHVSLEEASKALKLGGMARLRSHIFSILRNRYVFLAAERKEKYLEERLKRFVAAETDEVMEAMQHAEKMTWVIKSPWSGSPSWCKRPLGDEAGSTMGTLYGLLKGQTPAKAEKWPKGLFAKYQEKKKKASA